LGEQINGKKKGMGRQADNQTNRPAIKHILDTYSILLETD
jgi:hypothetical protein